MSQYIRVSARLSRRMALGLSLSAGALLVGACKSDNAASDSTALAADSTLNKDLALAGQDTSAQPQLQDVPATSAATPAPTTTPAPRRTTPARPAKPKPAPTRTEPAKTSSGNTVTHTPSTGGGSVGEVAAGTSLNLSSTSQICTNTSKVGDHVTATLDQAVSGSNGVSIPAGATVSLTVTQLKRSENAKDPIVMEFAVNSVKFGGHQYALDGTVTSASVQRIRNEPKSKDVQKVAIGAVAGAIAGRILGKSTKGAVVGGAAGAAAGAAAAAATANYEGCVNSGGSIVVRLNSPVQIKA
jgi:hypothetical protein